MNCKISNPVRCGSLLVALLFSVCPGHAQEVTARLDGTVRDTAGAVVPGAALSARNVSTGVATTGASDPSGNYVFPSLAAGTYTLSVEKQGFATRVITGITLEVAQKATVDLTLSVGQVNQTVTVEATAPLVDSTSASMGTVVTEQSILDLPLNLRRTGALALVVPGTIDTRNRSLTSANENGSGFNDNSYGGSGGRSSSNLILIDGMISRALNNGGFANALAGGWELSGIITFQSGFPFTVLSSQDFSNTASRSPRPDRVCNGAGPQTVAEWFDVNCFTTDALAQALANGTPRFGNSGRNILIGPGLQEWDISAIKHNQITERMNLEFRAEFFNLFNHPNFGTPGTVIGTSTAGQITSAGSPRDIQFGLKLKF